LEHLNSKPKKRQVVSTSPKRLGPSNRKRDESLDVDQEEIKELMNELSPVVKKEEVKGKKERSNVR
jgi:hypothetical protein